jgi:hypothetical protein
MMKRAFVFGVAVTDYNFTGRKAETERLKGNFEEGVNTILISPRRWGKTSLVKRVIEKVDKTKVIAVYLDMFACKSEYEFYNALAVAVLKQTTTKAELWMENAKDFLSRLTPKISVSAGPDSDIGISLGITPKTHTPEEILQLPEIIAKRKNKRIVLCIDEFQQIGEFADSISVQKRLRSVWQQQEMTSYCIFGSKKHLMSDVFQMRNMPFYQFGDMVFLQKIPTNEWVKYIVSHFKERNRNISTELATKICEAVDNFSSYVQQLALLVMLQVEEGKDAEKEQIENGIDELLDSNDLLFMQQIEPLTAYQMNFLKAIASGQHTRLGKRETREKFDLGSSSNIPRLRTSLIARDLVEWDGRGLNITDPVFIIWLKRRIFR